MAKDSTQLRWLITAILGGAFRWALTLWLGRLIERGYIQAEHVNSAALIGAGLIVSLLWALWANYRKELRVWLALKLGQNTSRDDLEKAVKRPKWIL